MEKDIIKDSVRQTYSRIASRQQQSCCSSGCCGPASPADIAASVGYRPEDLEKIPAEASLGLGCGNPVQHAGLKTGEIVVDLGSGAGMDVFLAASIVGPKGKAVGIDMTEEMVVKAAATARNRGINNVAFFRGEIENLPLPDGFADVVISNCVINLSVDKEQVFREIYRVLKPGGRIAVSDIVADRPIPQEARDNLALWAGCIAGAVEHGRYLEIIENTGFAAIEATAAGGYRFDNQDSAGMPGLKSITVTAVKPGC